MRTVIKKYSLRDVAELAGVSLGTASKVINNHYVKPALRIRVENAMKELDYVPNHIARSLKAQNTSTIGVIIPDIASPVYGMLLRGIEDIGTKTGYSIIIYDTNMSNGSEERALSLFKEKMVSGIIYASNTLSPALEQDIRNSQIPVALIMTTSSEGDFSTVTVDNEDAACQMTKYLIQKKHKRILHLAGFADDYNAGVPRYNGYVRALREAGIPVDPELTVFGGYSAERGYHDMKRLLKEGVQFTAVFAAADEVAIGAMKAMREQGLMIPEDYVVAGFDGIPIADYFVPSLCTVEQPFYQMGVESMKILVDTIELDKSPAQIVLPTKIKNRSSIREAK